MKATSPTSCSRFRQEERISIDQDTVNFVLSEGPKGNFELAVSGRSHDNKLFMENRANSSASRS